MKELISEKHQVANKAWELGEVKKTLFGHRVFFDGKMVIVGDSLRKLKNFFSKPNPNSKIHFSAFPHPNDYAHFVTASKGVKAGGPSFYSPGAIGTMSFKKNGSLLLLRFEQAHFVSEPREKTSAGIFLPRRLATKYGGWRTRAFLAALNVALDNGLQGVAVYSDYLFNRRGFSDELDRLCKKQGVERVNNGEVIVFSKKKMI